MTKRNHSGRFRVGFALLTVLALLFCVGTSGAPSQQQAGDKQKPKQKGAKDIAKEFVSRLHKGSMPWQFYKHYGDQ